MYKIIFLLLITSASFGQVLQETNGSRADNRNVFKLGFRLPQVCWVTGNPNLLNYSAFQSKGAMVYDTCAGKIKRWSGSVWVSIQDSTAGGGGTPGGGTYSIQYNRAGAFAGRSTFVFDTVNARVGIGMAAPAFTLDIEDNVSSTARQINAKNTNTTGRALFLLNNDNNNYGFIGSYGSAFGLTGYRNNTVVGSSKSLFIAAGDDGVAGANIGFYTGASLATEQLRIEADTTKNFNVLSNTGNISVTGAVIVTGSLNGRVGALTATAAGDELLSLKGAATHTGTFLSLKSSSNAEFAFLKANGTSATPNWYIGGPLNNFADPSNSAISAGAFIAYNASTTNFYGTGIAAIRSSKYDVWFQTGSVNGGGYRFYTEGTNERLTIFSGGNVGVNSGSTDVASAQLHVTSTTKGFLPPRMTTANRDAIATPAAGLSVYNSSIGTNDVYTSAWYQQPNGLTGSGTLDFPSTGAHSSSDLTITVTGAADGDIVILGVPNASVTNDSNYTAWVSAANTVTVRFNHYGSGNSNPASGPFKVYVIKN